MMMLSYRCYATD